MFNWVSANQPSLTCNQHHAPGNQTYVSGSCPLKPSSTRSRMWHDAQSNNTMESQPPRAGRNENKPPSTDVKFRKTNIDILGQHHHDAVASAISNILSTEIAETTYAQIVDCLPLPETLKDVYGELILPDHPIHQHTQLKKDTLDTVRRFRGEFDPDILQFDIPVS